MILNSDIQSFFHCKGFTHYSFTRSSSFSPSINPSLSPSPSFSYLCKDEVNWGMIQTLFSDIPLLFVSYYQAGKEVLVRSTLPS